MKIKFAACLLAVMGFVGLAASPASAAPIALHLNDGTTFVTVIDGGVGDVNPLDGVVTFVGSVGAWAINVSTGTGPLGPNFMDLNSVNTALAGTTTTLSVFFSQNNIATGFPGFNLEFGGTTTNASVTYSAFIDNGNALFGGTGGSPFASLGPFSGPFSGSTNGLVSATTPYSLTQAFFITGTGAANGSSFSGNAELNPVPEPGSLALLGGGLLGLASWARRRRQRKSEQ
jgi:hypothetical protein